MVNANGVNAVLFRLKRIREHHDKNPGLSWVRLCCKSHFYEGIQMRNRDAQCLSFCFPEN